MGLLERFPLAVLELDRAAKRRELYFYRALAVLAVFVAMLFAPRQPEQAAELLATLIQAVQYAAAFILPPLVAVPSIQREKQEQTLPLLMLADHSGHDIVLAKFITAFGVSALLIMGTLPMLALGAFWGGISVPDAALYLLYALCWGAAACALALLAAARSSTTTQGVLVAYLLTAAVKAGMLLAFEPVSGGSFALRSLRRILDLPLFGLSDAVLTLSLAILALAIAARELSKAAQEEEKPRLLTTPLRKLIRPRREPRPMHSCEDFLKRAVVTRVSPAGIAVGSLLALIAIPCAGVLGPICLPYLAAFYFTRAAVRSDAFEELWLTPYSDEDLRLALRRIALVRSWPCSPVLAIPLLLLLAPPTVLCLGGPSFLLALLAAIVFSVTQLRFVSAWGAWHGIASDTTGVALAGCVALVMGHGAVAGLCAPMLFSSRSPGEALGVAYLLVGFCVFGYIAFEASVCSPITYPEDFRRDITRYRG